MNRVILVSQTNLHSTILGREEFLADILFMAVYPMVSEFQSPYSGNTMRCWGRKWGREGGGGFWGEPFPL